MEKYFETYREALHSNEENTRKWEKYRDDLLQTEVNIKEFAKTRNVDIMVPMGKMAFVRGQIIHTNEITVCHGNGIFSDCSQTQSLDILKHRLQKCNERLKAFEKEKDLFSNKMNLPGSGNAFALDDSECIDILEESTAEKEEEYKQMNRSLWRERKKKGLSDVHTGPKESSPTAITDEELFAKLEEMELMEELNEELDKIDEIPDSDLLVKKLMRGEVSNPHNRTWTSHDSIKNSNSTENSKPIKVVKATENSNDIETKEGLELDETLSLLKSYRSKIETILSGIKKEDNKSLNIFMDLNELKDEINDDIDMLNKDGLQSDESEEDEEESEDLEEKLKEADISSEGENSKDSDDNTQELITELQEKQIKQKRRVSFSSSIEDIKIIDSDETPAETSNNNTLYIHFEHSNQTFDPTVFDCEENFVQHPADIYQKFKNYFKPTATAKKSILKNKENYYQQQQLMITENGEDANEKTVKKIYESCPIGDIVERNSTKKEDEIIRISSKDPSVKKVSKFKQMRQKS